MRLINRIEGLERKSGPDGHSGPEIIFLRAAGINGDAESNTRLQNAIFVGFERENLSALDGETDEEFGTRAEQYLSGLKRAKEAIEHRSNKDGK